MAKATMFPDIKTRAREQKIRNAVIQAKRVARTDPRPFLDLLTASGRNKSA